MEFLTNALWTLFWPWSILAGMIFIIYQCNSSLNEKDAELERRKKELTELKRELEDTRRQRTENRLSDSREIERLQKEVYSMAAQHRKELEQAKKASLDTLLNLKGNA